VDRVILLRLSPGSKIKAEKNRKEALKIKMKEKSEEKEEETLKKKKEKDLAYNEKLKTLPPE
jgi:hypothetical protein